MNILYFGDYQPNYNRTRVILKGLRRRGYTVSECQTDLKGWAAIADLYKKYRAQQPYQLMIVGYGDNRWIPIFATLISRTPVVWEPLISIYDAWVLDRKLTPLRSLKAVYYWIMDWLAAYMVDHIILDNDTHIQYFNQTFNIPMRKMTRALVGSDDDLFTPKPKDLDTGMFEVEYHGKYIPIHGSWVLVRAAKLLEQENIHITMIGGGQDVAKAKSLAEEIGVQNITFYPGLKVEEIVPFVRNADVCVGHLGDVPRVTRSIPNKLYEAAAAGRVSINADTPAVREIFTPGVDVIGVRPADPEALAKAILDLKHSGKAHEMGEKAYQVFMNYGTPEKVAEQIILALRKRFPDLAAQLT